VSFAIWIMEYFSVSLCANYVCSSPGSFSNSLSVNTLSLQLITNSPFLKSRFADSKLIIELRIVKFRALYKNNTVFIGYFANANIAFSKDIVAA
jgi:hypothetical protein